MNKIRLALVGAGLIWDGVHRKNIERHADSVSLAGICARSEETRKRVQEAFPDAWECASTTELFGPQLRDSFDAVLVQTPIALNAPVAKAALEAGKIVFLEKPAAMSEAQCNALEQAHAASTGTLYILENNYYDERFVLAEELVRKGRIGRFVSFERVTHLFMGGARNQAGAYGSSSWRMDAEFPLGIMFDGGIHDLAGLRRLAGPVDTVFSDALALREGFGEFDLIESMLRYRRGVMGSLSHASALPSGGNYTVLRGTEGTISFTGDGLLLRTADGVNESLPVEGRGSHGHMWDAVIAAAVAGRESEYTVADGLADVRTLLSIERSVKTRRPEFIGE